MASPQTTGQKINGDTYSHSSIEAKISDLIIAAIPEIEYGSQLEPGELRGTSSAPLATTAGEGATDGSVKLAKKDFRALIKKLGNNFMKKKFQIVVQYAEEGEETIVDTLNGCRITAWRNSSSSGTDAVMVDVDLHIMQPLLDDLSPYSV